VVTFDADLRILETNPQAEKLIKLGDYIDKSLALGTNNPGVPGLDWTGPLRATVSAGQRHTFDSISYELNGRTMLLRIVCAPLVEGATEKIVGGTVVVEDVTEMVNVQRQLASVERLATVGRIASTVAHELNNPMDGILRYINLALRAIEQENIEKPKEYLEHCREGIMRMVHIVSELLEFSRSTHGPFEQVGIDHTIEDAIKTIAGGAEASGIRIIRHYDPCQLDVRGGSLFQVFCNLVKNALDAMPDGGELHVSTHVADDKGTVIEFRDSGTGFDPEDAEAIFEPFFTTKKKGRGTGLGLAVCKDIVERHHGRIVAENVPAGGSVFKVYLPRTELA
jgi:signal transduction histidine kinase